MKSERETWITNLDTDCSGRDQLNGTIRLVGEGCIVSVHTNDDRLLRSAARQFRDGKKFKITLEFPESDVDEARRLLGVGQNSAAIAKALDILERLDK